MKQLTLSNTNYGTLTLAQCSGFRVLIITHIDHLTAKKKSLLLWTAYKF